MPLIELPGFEGKVSRHLWEGETLPVLYDGERICAYCNAGRVIVLDPVIQDALFFHGGYGESIRETVDVCLACHRVNVRRRESVSPRR